MAECSSLSIKWFVFSVHMAESLFFFFTIYIIWSLLHWSPKVTCTILLTHMKKHSQSEAADGETTWGCGSPWGEISESLMCGGDLVEVLGLELIRSVCVHRKMNCVNAHVCGTQVGIIGKELHGAIVFPSMCVRRCSLGESLSKGDSNTLNLKSVQHCWTRTGSGIKGMGTGGFIHLRLAEEDS